MARLNWKPGTLLYPTPVVLVTCGDFHNTANIITVAWAGTVCSEPVMVAVAIRPERLSHDIIRDSKEFAINLPCRKLARAVDFCGIKSGRDLDKFQATRLTREPARFIKAPLIAEAPLALECKVHSVQKLGSHDLFIGRVLGIQVDEDLIDNTGKLNLAKADLITYVHGQYWTLKEAVGSFGYSVRKKKKR